MNVTRNCARRIAAAALFAAAGLALPFAGAPAANAADWPQWRGPARDGAAPDPSLPKILPKELRQVWRAEVGEGHAGPVVAEGRVHVFARKGDNEVALALDAKTGKPLWSHAYPAPYQFVHAARDHGLGPKATPTVEGGRVYTFGIAEALAAYDAAKGEVLWQRQFAESYTPPWPEFGTSASPLVEGNLLIVQVGTKNKGALLALEKKTGKEVWRNESDGPAYAGPIAATLADTRQIVVFTQNRLIGVRATNGQTLWSTVFRTPYEQNIVTPVIAGEAIIYGGIEQPTTAAVLEPNRHGGKAGAFALKELWRNPRLDLYMSSPVARGDYLYMLSYAKKGTLACLDMKTGEAKWETPGRAGEYASLALAGDRILALSSEGDLKIFAADPAGYTEMASYEIADSPTWAHLALAGGLLYVKDKTHLACFEFPEAGAE